MTKAEIAKEVARQTGIDSKTVMTVIEAYMAGIKQNLSEGNEVFMRGFGSFILKKRAQKTARNITKNTTVIVPEHNIPFFKPSPEFKDAVKNTPVEE